jgi:hypothetical protein
MKHIGKKVCVIRRGKSSFPKEVKLKLLSHGNINTLVLLADIMQISQIANLADPGMGPFGWRRAGWEYL